MNRSKSHKRYSLTKDTGLLQLYDDTSGNNEQPPPSPRHVPTLRFRYIFRHRPRTQAALA